MSRTKTVEIWYPRQRPRSTDHVRIELIDVRAANDLIVHFDFDRDGWVLESPLDEGLEEVGFVPAFSPACEAEMEARR